MSCRRAHIFSRACAQSNTFFCCSSDGWPKDEKWPLRGQLSHPAVHRCRSISELLVFESVDVPLPMKAACYVLPTAKEANNRRNGPSVARPISNILCGTFHLLHFIG